MRFYEFEAALTPGLSPAKRERGGERTASRGEGDRAPRATRQMRQAARRLRRLSTHSEVLLWAALRNRQLGGRKFRREHPIGAFVVDFYCAEARLVVEIDGGIHRRRKASDRVRQEALESLGIRVLRLPAALVERNLLTALARIEAALTPGPSPALRERGGEQPASRSEGASGQQSGDR